MKSAIGFAGICFMLSFCVGCVSTINHTRLDISIDHDQQSKILPLKNSNNDINLYRIGAQIMENSAFLSMAGQAYGYYAVDVRSYNDTAPNFFILAWVNGLTLCLPSLIGFPTDLQEFDITACLYLFDSSGTPIKTYQYSDTFTKLAGLYYGQDPNKKASMLYSALFKTIIEQAESQNEEINYLLKQAGPITDANMLAARSEITEFLKKSHSSK